MNTKKVKQKVQENNYNLLKIICAIAVISIHVSATYTNAITQKTLFGDYYKRNIFASCSYHVLSRFAVPCFVMISGAFVLSNDRNKDYKYFYKKSLVRLGIPTIIFAVIYLLYSECLVLISGNYKQILNPIFGFALGKPFYHMWYMYMLIGVYLLAPIIIRFKNDVGEETFCKTAFIIIVLGCLSCWTSTHTLSWDIGFQFDYVGYFMIGYIIRQKNMQRKNNIQATLFVILGICVELIVLYLRYKQALQGIDDTELKYLLVEPQCPLVVLASIFIFVGFSKMDISREFNGLASVSLYIYLIHAGVWDVARRALKAEWDNRLVIPISIFLLFLSSTIFAHMYLKIWERIDTKWCISEKWCKLLKLI